MQKMADDNNTSDSIAAGAQITLFIMYASDWRMLTAKSNLLKTSYYQ